VKEFREETRTNYLNYFTSKVDNIGEYFERKNERIASMAAAKKQKLTDKKPESSAADLEESVN
jgi:hypothetical protein